MNQPPLNPDALGRMFATAMMEVLDAEKLQPGDRLVHVNDVQEVLNRLEKNILAAALPEVTSVEELEKLPIMTVAMFTIPPLERRMPFELCTINRENKIWMQPGDGAGYRNDMMARYLPATVIHLPDVKP